MIQPYRFFSIYRSTQMHFTSGYDTFKYGGKAKSITPEAFDSRNDRQRFVFWADKFDSPEHALRFCVFNFKLKTDWFYDAFDQAKERYVDGQRFFSAFKMNLKEDHDVIKDVMRQKAMTFEALTHPTAGGNKPPILQMYFQQMVSLEFICLLDKEFHFTSGWKENLDPLVRDEAQRIVKYTPFVIEFSKSQ